MSHHVQMAILRCCDYESWFLHYSKAYLYNWSLASACVYVAITGLFGRYILKFSWLVLWVLSKQNMPTLLLYASKMKIDMCVMRLGK